MIFQWGWQDKVLRAAMEAQAIAQREWMERNAPKGPLWFWEHIESPYLVGLLA